MTPAMAAGDGQRATAPLVAAAADLQYALGEISGLFARETGLSVRISFGSSGNFVRQIAQGAPFEIFLSADETYVEALAKRGQTADNGRLYAIGRLVVFASKGSPLIPDPALDDLAAALGDGRLRHLAIANPEHAPYGRAAREVLRHRGLWETLQGRLALGENAAQAAQFAVSGAAQAGLIPYSLAIAPAFAARGTYALLPEAWHTPLRQRMVLLKDASTTARQFYDFMRQPAARAIMERYGFVLPTAAAGEG